MKLREFSFDNSVGFLTYIVGRLLTADLSKSLAQDGIPLSTEQYRVLYKIWEYDGSTQKELADKLHQDKSNISRLVTHLEAQKYVDRKFSPGSSKSYALSITESGVECLIRCVKQAEVTLDKSIAGLSAAEVAAFRSVLTVMIRNLTR